MKPMRIILFALISFSTAACRAEPAVPVSPAPTSADAPYRIEVELDEGEPAIEVIGAPFTLTTNNCGTSAATTEIFSRERTYTTDATFTITEDIRASVGGGIPGALQANLQAGLEQQLGLILGSTESHRTEREIITPADQISLTTLQWQELWMLGTFHLLTPGGELLGNIPFRVISSLHLAQLETSSMACPEEGDDRPETIPLAITRDLPAALDCLSAHLLDPALPALCPEHWILSGANEENLSGYLLDRQLLAAYPTVDSAQWIMLAVRDVTFDEALSTPQAAVYTLQLETDLTIEGLLRCSSRSETASERFSLPLSGRARVEILHPQGVDEVLRVYSWVIEEQPLRTLCPLADGN